jgi:UrcA family protein
MPIMRNLFTAAAAIAVIASTPIAFVAFAPAAFADDTVLRYADLDLATPAGRVELDSRIDKAAHIACTNSQLTGTRIPSKPTERCLTEARNQIAAQVDARLNKVGLGG